MSLYQALCRWSASTEAMGGSVPAAQAIPLKRFGKTTPLVYTCAIAHRLALQSQHAAAIAAQLVDLLLQASPDDVAVPPGVSVQATGAGLIHFEVGDRAIAAWLDQLLVNALPQRTLPSAPLAVSERQTMLHSAAIFEAQYAHARCSSLLRLAHHEGLIRLERLEESPFYWRFSSPIPFPWLTSAAQLSLHHSADRYLLVQLFEALDRVDDPSQKRTIATLARSAQAVSQAFQTFHRVHPLWDQTEQKPVLTAQLGLLMATQRVLFLLLADGLHLCPAIEL
jgi:hypothetical protein